MTRYKEYIGTGTPGDPGTPASRTYSPPSSILKDVPDNVVRQTVPYIPYNDDDMKDHGVIVAMLCDRGPFNTNVLCMFHKKLQKQAFVMGKVEEGDTPEETLFKELNEELGIEPIEYQLIAVEKAAYERNGKVVNDTEYMFIVSDWKGKIENLEPEKHSRLTFVDLARVIQYRQQSDDHFTILTNKLIDWIDGCGINWDDIPYRNIMKEKE